MKITFNGKSGFTPYQIGVIAGAWVGSFIVAACEVVFAYLAWNYFICKQFNMPESTLNQVAAVIIIRNIIFSPIALLLQKLGNKED